MGSMVDMLFCGSAAGAALFLAVGIALRKDAAPAVDAAAKPEATSSETPAPASPSASPSDGDTER
jgi:hypothetical protein